MTNPSSRIEQLTPLQKAALALKQSQTQLAALKQQQVEPIAIVGAACRFPGDVTDPESYWRLLCEGRSTVGQIPADRWNADLFYDPDPAKPGKMNTRWGAFLRDVDQFDNAFFGISQREALRLDPQQRMLLELAWEALEDAGVPPQQVAGQAVGVYVGIAMSEYGMLLAEDVRRSDAFLATGTSLCIAANRISFAFDLHGPSLTLDTACSSSLVAVHLAVQSLRSGESKLALAGGVSMMFSPNGTISLTKAGFSSPTGQCRPFDADADGYVRGEGAGLLVLKRLSDAVRDRDPIYAVIRGTAVAQDGRSNGLTAPSRPSQEAVLRRAYETSGISPAQVQYVETQGTGTTLGDTVEALALSSVLTQDRTADSVCAIGSVKSNMGHAEAAAGVASLLKVALALKHRQLPPSLNFDTPNPNIPFEMLRLRVQQQLAPWPDRSGHPRLAGVSALGFGGTNAHVILEEAPAQQHAADPDTSPAAGSDGPCLVTLSAKHEGALRAYAAAYRDLLGDEHAPLIADISYTTCIRREHFDLRLAFVAGDRREARRLLADYLERETPNNVAAGRKPYGRQARAIFLCGHELQPWHTCAQAWEATVPHFAERLKWWDELLTRLGSDASIREWLAATGLESDRDDDAAAQLRLLALQVSLAETWKQYGIIPQAVIGLGRGKLAAAVVAGFLTAEQAARLLLASADALDSSTALHAEIPLFLARAGKYEILRQATPASLLSDFEQEPPLAAAAELLLQSPPDVILELDPEASGESLAAALPETILLTATAGGSEVPLLGGLRGLYALGFNPRWSTLYPQGGNFVRLPSYPWQRKPFWLEAGLGDAKAQVTHTLWQPVEERSAESDAGRALAADLLYRVEWNELPADRGETSAPAGNQGEGTAETSWLILADRAGIGRALADQLQNAGHACEVIPWSPTAMEQLRKAVDAASDDIRQVVHLWTLDAAAEEDASADILDAQLDRSVRSLPELVSMLADASDGTPPQLWLVTRGAVSLETDEHATALTQTPLWGLGRTLAQEHEGMWGGLVDLDPALPAATSAAELKKIIGRQGEEDEFVSRGTSRYVARLRPIQVETSSAALRADGAYLITGGLGGLGRVVAKWLVERGARRLILLARTALPERSLWSQAEAGSETALRIAAVRELEALGASVQVVAADVADEQQMGGWLAKYEAEQWPPIRGVFHLAGTSHPATIRSLARDALHDLLRPKLRGGWVLHRLFRERPLDLFCVFSSAAAVLSSPLLGGYAAANAFLDGLVAYRRQRGLPAQGINWGLWSEVGMGQRMAPGGAHAGDRMGSTLSVAEGRAALDLLLGSGLTHAVVLKRQEEAWSALAGRSMLKELASSTASPADADAIRPRPELSVPYVAPETELEKHMAALWAKTLRLERVGIHDNFLELGGDSLQGAILINRMQEELREVVHASALFEAQNIHDLTNYLRREYPAAVRRKFPFEVVSTTAGPRDADWPDSIEEAELERGNQLARTLVKRPPAVPASRPRNPRAVFVIAPPRSGTTLLRIMLGGNPALFAPPELELLNFETLGQRRDAYANLASAFLEGPTRMLMELDGCGPEEAARRMAAYEQQDLPVQEFYCLVQQEIAPRLLVDKTPAYAGNPEALRRAEYYFADPLYIHLQRHPCGMIKSFVDYKMDQTYTQRYGVKTKPPFSPHQMGEIVWVNSHRNILDHFETIAQDRQHAVRFEDLVREPEAVLRRLCEFLGVDYHPEMANPYHDKETKMTDGIVPEARMHGDQKFLVVHKQVDASVADRWKEELTSGFLGEPARNLAAQFGYDDIDPRHDGAGPPTGSSQTREPTLQSTSGRQEREMLAELEQISDDAVDEMLEKLLDERGDGRG